MKVEQDKCEKNVSKASRAIHLYIDWSRDRSVRECLCLFLCAIERWNNLRNIALALAHTDVDIFTLAEWFLLWVFLCYVIILIIYFLHRINCVLHLNAEYR